MKALSVIVPTKDRAGIVEESLRRLCQALKGVDAEVMVINDSATSEVHVPDECSIVRVLRNPGQGVASARNFGAAQAASDVLFFMDDDMWVDAKAIGRILELSKLHPRDAVNLNWVYPEYLFEQIRHSLFGRYLIRYGFTSMKGWSNYPYWKEEAVFESSGIAGACLVISKHTYQQIGGYHAGFPLAGFEDYDFSERLKKAGSRLMIDTTVLLYHNEANKASLEGWLMRYEKASITRRYAVEIGYAELILHYTSVKNLAFSMVYACKGLLFFLLSCIPNLVFMDRLYTLVANALLGAHIWKGYHSLPQSIRDQLAGK